MEKKVGRSEGIKEGEDGTEETDKKSSHKRKKDKNKNKNKIILQKRIDEQANTSEVAPTQAAPTQAAPIENGPTPETTTIISIVSTVP